MHCCIWNGGDVKQVAWAMNLWRNFIHLISYYRLINDCGLFSILLEGVFDAVPVRRMCSLSWKAYSKAKITQDFLSFGTTDGTQDMTSGFLIWCILSEWDAMIACVYVWMCVWVCECGGSNGVNFENAPIEPIRLLISNFQTELIRIIIIGESSSKKLPAPKLN